MGHPDFLKGTLDMLILKTLARGPNHGYGIAAHIRRTSQGAFKIGGMECSLRNSTPDTVDWYIRSLSM